MGDGTFGETVDVAVIGAGISGLHLARGLLAHDVSVVVFEGRDRIGGRLRSEPTSSGHRLDDGLDQRLGHRIDVGATWFWPGERRVAQLVRDFALPIHQQHLAGDAMYEAPDGVRRLDGNPIDVPSFRFSGGAEELASRLAADLPGGALRLSTAVTRVSGTGPFTVGHGRGELTAGHVVLALPPALAISSIVIDPPLPESIGRIARATPVWMGATTKAVAVYDQPFWRDAGLAGSAMSHVGPLREIHDMSGSRRRPAALFGFGQPTSGESIGRDDVVRQLARLFGPAAADAQEVIVVDWRSESLTSPTGVEQLRSYELFGHPALHAPVDRPLHWSSTETARESPGHIEGALDAAERTLAAILSG
ncbi:MAG: FAD-dependent oxidoreductase [Actinomycetota bacterium]